MSIVQARGRMARGQKLLIDGLMWEEGKYINWCCMCAGFLLMGVRSLGFLVLTWTTVVLLGGFVSALEKEDFWYLILITLAQITGSTGLSHDLYNASSKGLHSLRFHLQVNPFGPNEIPSCARLGSATRPPPGRFASNEENRAFLRSAFLYWLFDVLSMEKVAYIAKSVSEMSEGFCGMAGIGFLGLAACVVFVPYLVMMMIVLHAVLFLCLFGLLISAGISYWRLGQLDHYRDSTDEGANLKLALQILYMLVLCQGMLLGICLIFRIASIGILVKVDKAFHFDCRARKSLVEYVGQTDTGCGKDPSFAEGRNLVTYAVGLMMDSKLPDSYRSGVRILDALIQQQEPRTLDFDSKRHMLIKHLVGSASSSQILLKLLQMLDSRGPHDREMRERAARIIAYLAGEIHLDQFPRGIQRIASLLDTFEEYRLVQPYQRDWLLDTREQDWYQVALRLQSQLQSQGTVAARPDKREAGGGKLREAQPDEREDGGGKLGEAYKELLLQGLRILRKLAADEDNCRIMSNTKGLLPKIMAPVTSDLLHRSIQHHGAWSGIVEGSLRVMGRLVTAPGETGAKLRREISSNKEAISTVGRILKCADCGAELHKQAMGILTPLCMDEKYSSVSTKSRENFIKMLLDIFTHDNKDSSIRNLAGEALAVLSSKGGSNATIILQVNGDAVGSLTKVLLHVENKKCRISAAQVLEHLCSHCTKDDECLKKAMIDAMLKVLGEILRCGLTGEEKHGGKEANQAKSSAPESDIENQHDDSQDDGQGNRSSSHQQNDEQDEEEFEAALLSLCVTVCDTFSAFKYLLYRFEKILLTSKLEDMVQRNSNPTAKCLRTWKLTTKMVISIMKQDSYMQPYLNRLMELLSNASETMSDLDCSMIFAIGHHGSTRTLASLVKEAQELVDRQKAQEWATEFV